MAVIWEWIMHDIETGCVIPRIHVHFYPRLLSQSSVAGMTPIFWMAEGGNEDPLLSN